MSECQEAEKMRISDLLALAKRLEATTDNDPELFEDAFRACFQKPERIWTTDNTAYWTEEYSAWQERQWTFFGFIEVGAFLDAAMTLVPEGWAYAAYQGPSGQPHKWTLSTIKDGDQHYTNVEGRAKSPALALTAAALRSRAQQGGK